jgi:hypothetical protein
MKNSTKSNSSKEVVTCLFISFLVLGSIPLIYRGENKSSETTPFTDLAPSVPNTKAENETIDFLTGYRIRLEINERQCKATNDPSHCKTEQKVYDDYLSERAVAK